jgi:pimeloyl-ACP methyl ester carboxylesterase
MAESREEFMLAYQDSCAGLTLLLLHGFPLNSNLWEPQMDDLRDVARVLAPDLRGYGLSDAGEEPYTMRLMAGDCLGLLEAVGVQEPVVLCGHSMGGYVAFEFCRQYPEWVGALILVSTRAAADSPEGRTGRDRMAERAKADGVAAVADDMLGKLFAPQNYESDEELVAYVREMMESTSLNGMVGSLEAMKERPDSRALLAEIDVPVLIVCGEDDQLIPFSEAEEMRDAMPNAELAIIPNAGHLPNLEQPLEFNELVWDFLESLREEEEG